MLSIASLELRQQPTRAKSQKSSLAQLNGIDFLTAFFPKSLVSSATADAAFMPLTSSLSRAYEAEPADIFDPTTDATTVVGQNP